LTAHRWEYDVLPQLVRAAYFLHSGLFTQSERIRCFDDSCFGILIMASFDELHAKTEAAREEYRHALEARREATAYYETMAHPDGAQHLHHAHEMARLALSRYTAALNKLTDHVLNIAHASQSGASTSDCEHTSGKLPEALQVLLVEDNIGEAQLFEEVATHVPWRIKVTIAHNCAGALATISDNFEPHLVIADLGVLEFGGIELMKRCNPRGIAVVVFSGSLDTKSREHILRLGAKEFVEKPIGLDDYTEAVSKIIRKWAPRGTRPAT
jgi:CheY-like chemotaxis protein